MTTPACLTASVSDNAEAVRYKTIPGYRGRLLTTAGASALSSTYLFALEPNVAGKDGTQRIGVDETGRICVVGAFREPRTLLDHSGLLRTDCDSTQ
jgi:hypothetical protein